MKMTRILKGFIGLAACGAGQLAQAGLPSVSLELGDHDLLANTAGQTVQVSYSNSAGVQAVSGMTVALTLGGGDPPGGADGPVFADSSATATSPFNGITPIDGFSTEGQGMFSTFEVSGPASSPLNTVNLGVGSGLDLMTLTIDTTGFVSGTYALEWVTDSVVFNDANGGEPFTPTFVNGTITVVPEPAVMISAIALLGFAGGRWLLRRAKNGSANSVE